MLKKKITKLLDLETKKKKPQKIQRNQYLNIIMIFNKIKEICDQVYWFLSLLIFNYFYFKWDTCQTDISIFVPFRTDWSWFWLLILWWSISRRFDIFFCYHQFQRPAGDCIQLKRKCGEGDEIRTWMKQRASAFVFHLKGDNWQTRSRIVQMSHLKKKK